MEKIKCYQLKISGSYLISKDFSEVSDNLKLEVDQVETGESLDFEIEVIEMSKEEYNNLPEFEGF